MKLFSVTVRQEADIYVIAESQEAAELAAKDYFDDLCLEAEAFGCEAKTVPPYSDGTEGEVVMPDGTVEGAGVALEMLKNGEVEA